METPNIPLEETGEKNFWKIALYVIGLLGCLGALFLLMDFKSMGDFWNLDSTKHYLTSVTVTVAVILAFRLYREIKNYGHTHVSHDAQHALLGGLHGDLISAVMFADRHLKSLKINSDDIKKFHGRYLAGLGIIAILTMTLVVPIFGLISHGLEDNPTFYTENGEGVNIFSVFFYYVAYNLRIAVAAAVVVAFLTGWRRVKPGNKGLVLLNGNIIATREFGDGYLFTIPFLPTVIELMQVESEIAIGVELNANSEPKLITASKMNAVYDKGAGEKARLDRDTEDGLHEGRLIVSEMTVVAILRLADMLTFCKTKVSLEEVRGRMMEMVQTLRLETIGKKDYAQITGFLEVVRKRIEITMNKELVTYDNCLKVKNILISKVNFMKVIDKRIELTMVAPVKASM